MLDRLRRAGLIWPALLALAGLGVLLALGTWQMQRKSWKEGLVRQIAARAAAEPRPISAVLESAAASEPASLEYTRVRVRGRFLHDRELHLHANENGIAGWHVVTPLLTPQGILILVNRGFVPDGLKDRSRRVGGLVEGEAEFNGLIRPFPSGRGAFIPDNDLGRNQWYWLDRAAVVAWASDKPSRPFAGFLVETERVTVAIPPAGGATRLSLANRHLEYALTWYGLAATLAGVFAAFAIGRLKGRP